MGGGVFLQQKLAYPDWYMQFSEQILWRKSSYAWLYMEEQAENWI